MLKKIVAVTGNPTAAFELAVVGEVFGMDRSPDGLPKFDFSVCTEVPGLVPTNAGFSVNVEHSWDQLAGADLVVIPSWDPHGDIDAAERLVPHLRAAHQQGAILMSVCSGAFLLALTGLLDNRQATTHWKYASLLQQRFPAVDVDPNALFVDEGPVVTSAGTAAGIDACLHLVRRELGASVANAIARRMVVPPQRKGGQAQFIETPPVAELEADRLSDLVEWARASISDPLSVNAMAERAHMSPRTFARRFKEYTGVTPHQWILDQRLLAAEELLERTDLPIELIARKVGLGTGESMRRHFAARKGISPLAYRQAFQHVEAHVDVRPLRHGLVTDLDSRRVDEDGRKGGSAVRHQAG